MSVVIDAVSIVVRVQTIEDKYPGGLQRYEWDCPNRTFCCDGLLTRVAFMTGADGTRFTAALEQRGLIRQRDGIALEIAVIEQFVNYPSPPCPWLVVGLHFPGYTSAWLADADPRALAHPSWWTAEHSVAMKRVPEDQINRSILPLTPKGPQQEVLDYDTGKINYVGHAYPDTPPSPNTTIAPPDTHRRPNPERPQ
jgi:hypothetical protein